MAYQTLLLTTADNIARLTLNRPEKLNSFTVAMHAELRAVFGELAHSKPRVLIISGAGKAFCAGQDLSEREPVARGERIDLGASIENNFKPLVQALQSAPFPTVAKVQGVAAGAGASLALACDLAIAGRSASFVQSFVRIGLAPDAGASWQLMRRAGLARALGLAMLGDKINATEAAGFGLIWQCVEDAELDAAVDATAAALARLPTAALLAIRRAMHAAGTNSLDQQLNLERDLQRELGYSADYREGVTAFLQKRTPQFGK